MENNEYCYGWGLSEEQKQRISQELGVKALSLEDYANAKDEIKSIDVDTHVLYEVIPENEHNGE